jgi:hypothetical protein
VGTYLAWRHVNTSQEYRYYLSQNYPTVLEAYYSFGESIGSSKVRELDAAYFKTQEEKSSNKSK